MVDFALQRRIEMSEEGLPTLSCGDESGKKYYLHSRVAPSRDARIFEKSFDPKRYDVVIMLGTGLGYHLMPLRESLESLRALVLVDVWRGTGAALAENPLTSFLAHHEKISLVAGLPAGDAADAIASVLDFSRARGVQVLTHAPSARECPEYYATVRRLIENEIHGMAGGEATRRAFGLRYLRNALANLKRLKGAAPFRSLEGALDGVPALVVTSGPSLTALMPAICSLGETCAIIAADSALTTLAGWGVAPDFAVSVDPQPFIREHLRALPSGAPVLTTLTAHPDAFACRTVLSLNSHPVSQLVDELFPGVTGSASSQTGNVAGDALMAAVRMGASPIGIAGFDFSFPRLEIYARGTAYQERYAKYFHARENTVETQNMRYIMRSSRALKRDGIFTRRSFLDYRASIERLCAGMPDRVVRNLSGDGLAVGGVPFVTVEEFTSMAGRGRRKPPELFTHHQQMSSAIEYGALIAALSSPVVRKKIIESSLGESGSNRAAIKVEALIERCIETLEGC